MLPEMLISYEMWDLLPTSRFSHSRLYHLEPIGVGTADVECLTGYIARLAQTHGVTPRQLMLHELAPLLGRERLTLPVNSGLSAFWSKDARSLNSIGHLASDMVQVLQSLTLRQDLRPLTMLAWVNVFPTHGLIRRNRVWCPVCYETWQQLGQVIYEPLIWNLDVITICTRHSCYLSSTCCSPECQQKQSFLAPRFVPGHCSHCGQWLGMDSKDQSMKDIVSEDEWNWQTWVTHEVETLFASAPTLKKEIDAHNIFEMLTYWIDLETQGNIKAFARKWQISPASVYSWKVHRQRPQFDTLLRFCYFYDVSLLDVLLQGTRAVKNVSLVENKRMIRPGCPKRPHRVFDHVHVLATLQSVLASDAEPPLAMRQVCKEAGYDPVLVYHHYPDLCRAISARFMTYQKERGKLRLQHIGEEVRQAAFTIHSQGKYPSAYRIQAILSVPGAIRHPDVIAVWHEALRELGWES